ncbi:MAG: cation-translocating P-type ATPase [bacterium]
MKQWWQLDISETEKLLATDLSSGLTQKEAELRLQKYGPNQLKEKKGHSPFRLFLEQFRDFIIWVLLGAAFVSGFLGEWVDAWAIVVIVILNALLGFIQEYRAEKSLAALKKLSSPTSKVIRDGKKILSPSSELVTGDLIEIEAGDNIPADCRLVSLTPGFATHEASLTGESNPVMKTALTLEEKSTPLADRVNMTYMGTSVSSGKARAAVTETGMQTELGKIAGMIQSIGRESTPLQKKLEQFGKWIVYLCFGLVGIVFLLGILRGGKVIDMFLTAVSLAVAAIPEGLPAVVTIALALGVQRMVKRHALIRKLPSVETLGSATVICTDKTGTLTKNEMTVQAVFTGDTLFRVTGVGYEPKGEFLPAGERGPDGQGGAFDPPDQQPDLQKALSCCVLCNGAQLVAEDGIYRIIGDPTEGALLSAAAKAGLLKDHLEEKFPLVEEIPFDSDRKKMTIVRKGEDGRCIAFVKGAPDVLLDNCRAMENGGQVKTLSESDRKRIFQVNSDLADQAMRVLAVAYRVFDAPLKDYNARDVEKDLVFLGLVAMIDPAREEAKEAIKKCGTAGIRTVMITGDHKLTATAIARQLGFFKEDSRALTGDELDTLSDDELYRDVEKISVYARVSPEHKLRVVRAWRKRGEVVAMTGDGVNDAPALKEADIGVAMGITGTDVTKEVSDMVITDDNFASIVAAVEEGRGIYDNIKKFIHYLLSCNAGEILVMLIASLAGMPVPLLPIHILWINLVTDGLPALALGVDPADPNIMLRPPHPAHESVITRSRGILMLFQGSFIAICSLLAFSFILFIEKGALEQARTAAFMVLACSQLFHSFNCRSMTASLFSIGVFTNKKLLIAAALSFLLQMAAIYIPFLQVIFKTRPLGLFDLILLVAVSSFPLWAMELAKMTPYPAAATSGQKF